MPGITSHHRAIAIAEAIFIFGLITLSASNPGSAKACSGTTYAASWTPPTIPDRVKAADLILEGTVISVTGNSSDNATVLVNQYFKGNGPTVVTISGWGPCLLVYPDQHFLFFTTGNINFPLRVENVYSPNTKVSQATITNLIAATGHPPYLPDDAVVATRVPATPALTATPVITPPAPASVESAVITPGPTAQPTAPVKTDQTDGWLIATGVGLVVLGGVVSLIVRQRRRL